MIDLTNPSLLVMTEFELLAAVAAFVAVAGMALCDLIARRRKRTRTPASGSR
jgi:hypothetical protein